MLTNGMIFPRYQPIYQRYAERHQQKNQKQPQSKNRQETHQKSHIPFSNPPCPDTLPTRPKPPEPNAGTHSPNSQQQEIFQYSFRKNRRTRPIECRRMPIGPAPPPAVPGNPTGSVPTEATIKALPSPSVFGDFL